MKMRISVWWSERDTRDVLAVIFIAACVILVLVNLSMYPVYLDIPYHLAVTRGFREAGGITTWDFWDYAPEGRPHIYPPLLHVGMSMLQDLGLSSQATATLVCAIMFPLILFSAWWALRRLFGPRTALYSLVLLGVPYAFFYQSGITIAASLVLALTPLVFLTIEEGRKTAAAVLLAMCLYSHLILGHLLALALFVYLLHRYVLWKRILAVLAVAYLLYLPWGIVVLSNLGSFSASEPGVGGGLSLHLLLWGLAAAGLVACYLRRKSYYLLPAYFISMVPIAFFYPHRFWEGHVFLPLAMLGGVALDRLHAFLSKRLSRRAPGGAYAGALAGAVLGGLLVLLLLADPVLASSGGVTAAPPERISSTGAVPRERPFAGAPRAGGRTPPRITTREAGEAAAGSLRISLRPTTLPVLLGLEDTGRRSGFQDVFSAENEELMEAVLRYSEPGDIVFTPDGRLGDLVYAMTGRYATQGMFHEVQPEEQPDPLEQADLAVIPLGLGAASVDALPPVLPPALEGWSEVARAGRYALMENEDPEGTGGEAASPAVPLWVAYALLAAAAITVVVDCLLRRGGRAAPGGGLPAPPQTDDPARRGGNDVLAVVPARDEGENIAGVVAEIRRECPGVDVLVVDDGSSDGTFARARDAGAMVLRLEPNRGVGEAERRALSFAYSRGYSFAVRLDGDGQHPAGGVEDLLSPLRRGEADAVVGSRFLAPGGGGCPVSWERRMGMAYFRALLRLSTSRRFSDPTSGFRAYSRRAMSFLSRIEPRRYPEVVSLRLLTTAGIAVAEVPVEMRPRRGGVSSIGAREALSMLAAVSLDLLRPAIPGDSPSAS